MMLIDEGKLKLDDPVAKYIPSFANVKVGVEKKADDGSKTLELVPPNRPLTVLDLMRTPRASPTASMATAWSARPIRPPTSMHGDFDLRRIRRADRQAAAARSAGRALGIRPFHRHSGPRSWRSCPGNRCLQVEKEKLLDPLGMKDTGFFVTDPEKQKLLAQPMPNDSDFRVGREYTTRQSPGNGNPPAAAWSRPWRTMRALRRCCSMAARSMARPISARRHSS